VRTIYIRSQDKTAIIKLQYIQYVKLHSLHVIQINGVTVGEYATKAKAMEQLNKISSLLRKQQVKVVRFYELE